MKRNRAKKEWSPDGYIKSALRRIWRWSPYRKRCLLSGKCAYCHIDSRKTKLFADHISPVVDPKKGFQGWDCYIERLFTQGGLQPLCDKCHGIKSKGEAKERAKYRKERKALALALLTK